MSVNISVVIPTANDRPMRLARSIRSVLRQAKNDSIDRIQIIISNNSSRPLSDDLETLLGAGQGRIVDSSQVRGVSYARNRGAQLAQHELIAFLDDDDWWDDSFLAEMSAALLTNQVDLVCCGFWRWSSDTERTSKQPDNTMTIERFLVHNPGIIGSNILLRKSVYYELGGFDETLPTCNDKDFFIRFLQQDKRYCAVDRRLLNKDCQSHRKLTGSEDGDRGRGIFYRRYAALMDAKSRREYVFQTKCEEARRNRSYATLVKLLIQYPRRRRKLQSLLGGLVECRHPRLHSTARSALHQLRAWTG